MRGDIFAAGVIVAIGAVLLVLAFVVLDDGGRQYEDMGFEDYRELTESPMGSSGPIEIVSIGGHDYAHATGLGHGTIVYQNRTDYINVVKSQAVIVLMNGQSNAAYYHADASTATVPDRGQGFYFGFPDEMTDGYDDVSGCEWYDFVGPDGTPRVGDRGPGVAKTFNDLTGKKVLWVSLGIPGRMITAWLPPSGAAWVQDTRIVKTMMEKMPEGFEVQNVYMAWSQGESDYIRNTGYDHYIQTFKAIHDADIGIEVDGWLLMEGRTLTCGWVNEAFRQLASDIEDVEICTSIADTFEVRNGLMETDDLHYSQLAENALGAALGRYIAGKMGYSLPKAPVYLLETIVRCAVGDSVDLEGVTTARNVDGKAVKVSTTWNSVPSTATAGIATVSGIADGVVTLPGTPDASAVLFVGYIGYDSAGFELMENAAGGLTLLSRDSLTLGQNVEVPDTVTEIGDYALHWGPWTSVELPDSVKVLGYRSIQTTQLLQTLQVGSGITSASGSAFSAELWKDGVQLTSTQWHNDPSLLEGVWEWDGTTPAVLYYQDGEP